MWFYPKPRNTDLVTLLEVCFLFPEDVNSSSFALILCSHNANIVGLGTWSWHMCWRRRWELRGHLPINHTALLTRVYKARPTRVFEGMQATVGNSHSPAAFPSPLNRHVNSLLGTVILLRQWWITPEIIPIGLDFYCGISLPLRPTVNCQ